MRRLVWQVRTAMSLYTSVRRLLVPFVVSVVAGVVLEALALAAIVPLIGGGDSVTGIYADFLALFGLSPTDGSLIGVIAVLFVARSGAQYCSAVLGGLVIRREAVRLQVELFGLYLGLRWEKALRTSKGEINLLLNTQTQEVATFMYRCITMLEGVMYAVGLGAVAIVISPMSTILAIALIGISLLAVGGISRRVRSYSESVLVQSQEQAGRLLEYAGSASLMRSYHVTSAAILQVGESAEERERLAFKSQRIESLGWVLPDLLFVLALLTVVAIASRSGAEFAEVGGVIALLYRVSQYLKRFGDLSSLTASLPTIKAVHRFRKTFQQNQAPPVHASIDRQLSAGVVEIRDVGYRYEGADHDALDGVTVTAASGDFVGIVGASGSGKSTLVQILVGLLQAQRGVVRLGGDERGDHATVGYVPQAPIVLTGTIRSNVRWFRDFSDADVLEACDQAGLTDLLSRLPSGIETPVSQDGASLSGGERQRLALARALVGRPAILVLDEATSALDAISEAAIQDAIAALHGHMTVIAVAHRIGTVMGADRIVVLDGGRVVEAGSPEDLMNDETSRLRRLAGRGRP